MADAGPRALVALAIAVALAGCTRTVDVQWRIDGGGAIEAARIELEIRRGGCDDGALVLDRGLPYARGPLDVVLPALDRGEHCFVATLIDDACRVVGVGRTTVSIPTDGSDVVTTIAPLAGPTRCAVELCRDGACTEPDASVPPDAPIDAPVDAPSDAGPPPDPVVQLAALDQATCARRASGAVLCWGTIALVSGGTPAPHPPAVIEGLDDAIGIDGGAFHACALTPGSTVRCWGYHHRGQLGVEPIASTWLYPPTAGLVIPGTIVDLGVGGDTSCVVVEGAGYRCWGDGSSFERGDGTTTPEAIATPTDPPRGGADTRTIDQGASHACSSGPSGLACFGANSSAQIGTGSATTMAIDAPRTVLPAPIGARALGAVHTCAVSAGTLYCWGANTFGQCGQPASSFVYAPRSVALPEVTALSAGGNGTCAIASGRVHCWGHPRTIGDGIERMAGDAIATPTPIAIDESLGAVAIALGATHACAAFDDGSVWCWGDDTYGQMGRGTSSATTVLAPVQVVPADG